MQAKQVALWMLLVSANAQLRTSTTCSIPCKPGEFKADPLVVLCGGGRCTAEVTLGKGKDRTMITLPVGTKGVELKIDADDDMDIELQDASDGHCIAGARCTGASFEAVEGCANPTDYCLQCPARPAFNYKQQLLEQEALKRLDKVAEQQAAENEADAEALAADLERNNSPLVCLGENAENYDEHGKLPHAPKMEAPKDWETVVEGSFETAWRD
ncbi:unnamed protein product [Effrenium voratum]|nr:unnamed protein product [Effrenium voratum]